MSHKKPVSNPSWEDLQALGCKQIGRVIRDEPPTRLRFHGTNVHPVCSDCKQAYRWNKAMDEWEHPYDKEWENWHKMNKVRYNLITDDDVAAGIVRGKKVSLAALGLYFEMQCATNKADALEFAEVSEAKLFNELVDVGLITYK